MIKKTAMLLTFAVGLVLATQPVIGEQRSTEFSAGIAQRLNDPYLLARGKTHVYSGEHLTAINLPVGGIGAGYIQINGKAERATWQIFNNFKAVFLPHSFFAVKAKSKGSQTIIRALQTKQVGPFEAMNSLIFRGEYPFGWYDFEDDELPVKVSMETFNPLIPLNARDSAIPCAVFNLTAENISDRPVEVSFLATQRNAVGLSGIRSDWHGPSKGILLADFESSDYGDWKTTGDAFGDQPAKGAPHEEQKLKNFRGKGLVNTYGQNKDKGTGILTSSKFTIERNYIYFLIGGGNHPGKTCINLLIDGNIVHTATGDNNDAMKWCSWDVSNSQNKQAQIQIVDKESGGWGHIDIDYIVMSDEQLGDQIVGFGQNRNCVLREKDATILYMTTDKDRNTKGYGDMALIAFEDKTESTASWENLDILRKDWLEDGKLSGSENAGPSPTGQTLDGAIAKTFTLKPGEQREVRFVLTWHFPNAQHGDEKWYHEGNMYANWWSNALDVTRYLKKNLDELTLLTRLYHKTLYASNLPHWLLDRISSQIVVLHSKTCFWAKDGYFGGWEGCGINKGSCYGNCAHVWQYAQAHARLFPSVARKMREQALRYQDKEGNIPNRQPTGFDAIDGQCGEILGAYREHLTNADRIWLDKHWRQIRKAMEHTIRQWDEDEDGVLAGAQHNTLDADLGGSTSWLGTLYLAALEASERMAKLQNDTATALRYKRIRESGAKKQNETLWNGEYYIQIPDPKPYKDYNNGCHIDQVLGEWWANQLGMEPHYPRERVRLAMRSLLKYNFRTDFHGFKQVPRKFVDDSDAGMLMITWPKGDRPVNHTLYADEVMSGFEYSVAAMMVQTGMLKEGLMVVKAISDRYDGQLRPGLSKGGSAGWGYSGNPFGDDECGKFYARAMSIWSMLLACQGFIYDGPAGIIGFKPIWKPEDHISFFTAAEGWGLFTQKRNNRAQTEQIEVKYGSLQIRKLLFELPKETKPVKVAVLVNNRKMPVSFAFDNQQLWVILQEPVVLEAGSALKVNIEH